MKVKLLSLYIVFCYAITNAQSTNIDRLYVNVSYIKLPSTPILDDSKRTYATNSKFIYINGFSKVTVGGTLDIDLDYHGIEEGGVRIRKNETKVKDDDGNIVGVQYTYQAVSSFSSSAVLFINNRENGSNEQKDYFEENTYESQTFNSSEKALNYYSQNQKILKKRYRSAQWVTLIRRIRGDLNDAYGYVPFEKNNEAFQVLSSKKHPEYAKHQEIYRELQGIFQHMKYNEPVEGLALRLKPIIAHYEEVIKKYSGTKRKDRKIRHASYYNIAKIYYYLDQPDKVNAYGQKIIDNDFSESDGRGFINMADKLQEKFDANQIKTRHFEILTEDLTGVDLSEIPEIAGTNGSGAEALPSEGMLAYLITTSNDTIKTQISSIDISKISYGVELKMQNDASRAGTTFFEAKDCKTLALGNGDTYKAITFKEESDDNSAIESPVKLVKVLFESDKINLYLFNNKELVLKLADQEKGLSTLSSDFVFGIDKQLSKICADCSSVLERTINKEFKNTEESLLAFCKAFSACE